MEDLSGLLKSFFISKYKILFAINGILKQGYILLLKVLYFIR